jgi:hypothetical protein
MATQSQEILAAGIKVPGLPKIPIPTPSLPSWANPFNWLKDEIHKLLTGLTSFFETILLHPPRPPRANWQDYLFGNALGLTPALEIFTVVLVVVIALFHQGYFPRVTQALLMIIVLACIIPIFFSLCDYLIAAGDQLAQGAVFYNPPDNSGDKSLIVLPTISDVLGGVIGFTVIGILGFVLIMFILVYELVIIAVKFAFLPAYALKPLNERTERWFGRIVSLALVSMLFGRAAAVFCLELGKLAANNLPFNGNTFIEVIYLAAGFVFAIAVQISLLKGTSHVYSKATGGRVSSDSKVRGKVDTNNTKRQKVDVGGDIHGKTKGPLPVRLVKPPLKKRVKDGVAKEGGRRLAERLVPGAAAKANPYAFVAYEVGSRVKAGHKRRKQAKQEGSSEKTRSRPTGAKNAPASSATSGPNDLPPRSQGRNSQARSSGSSGRPGRPQRPSPQPRGKGDDDERRR